MIVEGEREGFMNKARLEWIMSGLNQYRLTQVEDRLVKSALENFDQNQMLTEHQEERLENLYTAKSKMQPNKASDYYTFKESPPPKAKPRRPKVY